MISIETRLARGEVAIFGDVMVRQAVEDIFGATVATLTDDFVATRSIRQQLPTWESRAWH